MSITDVAAGEKSHEASAPIITDEEVEARVIRLAKRPIMFEEFLVLNINNSLELIDGVMVEKVAAQLEHEKLIVWLLTLLNAFVRHKRLGIVVSSRMTVKIDDYRGRLPDLLFVRQDRIGIVDQRAVYGAPDLVIELISPHDRPSDRIALETDYRAIGVPEIIFIDQQKLHVLILRQGKSGYEEIEMAAGALNFVAISGFAVQLDWLFGEPRPDEFDLLRTLLNEP
jgi:Uma2 family endonuclease